MRNNRESNAYSSGTTWCKCIYGSNDLSNDLSNDGKFNKSSDRDADLQEYCFAKLIMVNCVLGPEPNSTFQQNWTTASVARQKKTFTGKSKIWLSQCTDLLYTKALRL